MNERMTLITKFVNFYYKVMLFRLKNVRATYQRLMDKEFKLGKNLEVYVDDIVVKYDDLATHIAYLEEVFDQLKMYNMRLNPEKCIIWGTVSRHL